MAVTMRWPATCKVVTQQYGNRNARYAKGYHTGIDIGCKPGSPIYAAHDGTVTVASWQGSYGNTVEVKANDSLTTSYHHMSRIAASKGQNVSAGTVIGYIGSTGMSTGPHLHFEVRVKGTDVDPNPYLSGAATIDQISTSGQQAGFSDVFEFPVKMLKMFSSLSDGNTWLRLGMVLLGAILLFMTFAGMAKAKVLGKSAVSAVKKIGASDAKS